MGRSPCSSKEGLNRGMWTAKEDMILSDYIRIHGDGGWTNLPKKAGLMRCGKSCRLRWANYLRPDIIRGNISPEEEELIIRLHRLLGNRWSLIAGRLPRRTDNEIKNYWNCHLNKKMPSIPQSPLIAGRLPGRTDNDIKNYWNCHLSKKMPSITQSQSQHNGTKNLKTSSKSAPLKSSVLKPTPMRVKTAVMGNLPSSPSHSRSEVFCREPVTLAVQTNGIEVIYSDQRNVQSVNCLTNAHDDGMEDFFDNILQVDWIQELDFDLQKTSPRSLGLLLLESERDEMLAKLGSKTVDRYHTHDHRIIYP